MNDDCTRPNVIWLTGVIEMNFLIYGYEATLFFTATLAISWPDPSHKFTTSKQGR